MTALQEAYARSLRESSAEVAHEVRGRAGPRIRELETAVLAMEESPGYHLRRGGPSDPVLTGFLTR